MQPVLIKTDFTRKSQCAELYMFRLHFVKHFELERAALSFDRTFNSDFFVSNFRFVRFVFEKRLFVLIVLVPDCCFLLLRMAFSLQV